LLFAWTKIGLFSRSVPLSLVPKGYHLRWPMLVGENCSVGWNPKTSADGGAYASSIAEHALHSWPGGYLKNASLEGLP